MPTAEEALETSRANPHDRWAMGDASAAARLAGRIVVPAGRQSFAVLPGETFFAIGSCFARNVEERLEEAGTRVLSREIGIPGLGSGSAREGGIFNKYTPVSILQELRWASGAEAYPEAALLPAGGDQVLDPYLSAKAAPGTRAALMARRQLITAYFAKAFAADIVILTLGLIESWIDTETGLHLNETPHPKILARNPGRFRFERLSLEQCEAALRETCAILARHGRPGQRIVVTVSPVPLGRTFSADDIILANTLSKSVLRVVAERVVADHEGVDYFPSYEAAMLSDPALSWQSDRLHVSDFVVGHIIRAFLSRYGIAPDIPVDTAAEIAALKDDALWKATMASGGDTEALLARMSQETNKYKTMVIKLQAELRQMGATAR